MTGDEYVERTVTLPAWEWARWDRLLELGPPDGSVQEMVEGMMGALMFLATDALAAERFESWAGTAPFEDWWQSDR